VIASVPYRLESLAAILKCGVPVLTLAPHSLADVYQDIRLLGDILHAQERAEVVVEEMVRAVASTQTRPLRLKRLWSIVRSGANRLFIRKTWVAELVPLPADVFWASPAQ